MADVTTPLRKPRETVFNPVIIPPSPFLKKLGYGTGVAVYKLERSPVANQVRSPWAIKKLLKKNIAPTTQYSKRLHEEASILRQLNHPHIVGFRAFIKNQDNQDCLAMEECNDCLGNMIEERFNLGLQAYPAKTIMKVAIDIADALNYLHTQVLLLHCDVKSFNILIQSNFNVCKLCDFGVTLPLTSTGEIDHVKAGEDAEYVGTRLWSAPEVLEYPQIITSKADIYSFGLVLWEMLALCPPCLDSISDSSLGTGEELDEEETSFGKRPELPSQDFDDSYKFVLEIFHCCTERDPAQRPTAQDLIISLPEMIKELENGSM